MAVASDNTRTSRFSGQATAHAGASPSASGAYPVSYQPTISRPDDPRNIGWTGRRGRAEHVVLDVCKDLHLRPEKTVVYICGNPDMILNAESALMDHGFPEFHVKKELYWPKGKPSTG